MTSVELNNSHNNNNGSGDGLIVHQAPPPLPLTTSQINAINTNNNNDAGSSSNAGNMAILARLKELEMTNQQMAKAMEDLRGESSAKEEKIKALSADKRKDMEQMIETAIDTWLNSLTGISDDVRKQFRTGISRIAEHADMKNAAWEVVCQASTLHNTNVAKIEELIKTCNDQTKTIESLVGSGSSSSSSAFGAQGDRMMMMQTNGGGEPAAKRARIDEAGSSSNPNNNKTVAATEDAWDLFSSMLRENSRSVYF